LTSFEDLKTELASGNWVAGVFDAASCIPYIHRVHSVIGLDFSSYDFNADGNGIILRKKVNID
jgi:hypothetical protein